MKFDDFKETTKEIQTTFEETFSKLVSKFLTQNGIRKVDALRVKLVEKPFQDIVVGFMEKGQVFLLNRNEVKAPRLQEILDSALAEMFLELEKKELLKMCESLETLLIQKFTKKTKKPQ